MSQTNDQTRRYLLQGQRLHKAGRLAEAGDVYRQILASTPGDPETRHMMGVLLLQLGQADGALAWIEQAIESKRSVPAFHVHRAHALLALGRPVDAADAAGNALRLKPAYAEAFQALGHALTDQGQFAKALGAYQHAVRLKPDLPGLLNNLGVARHHANQLDDAVRTLNRAHAHQPDDPDVLINLSGVLKDLGRFADAENRLAAALRLAPGDPRALYNRALLLLLAGHFQAAWPGWEERFRAGAVRERGLPGPRWRGEPLNGRTLLIHAEQGLGDTIQFCRFPLPADGPVVFEVPARMVRLLSGLPKTARIVAAGERLPSFDLVCPLMSLPGILGTIPAQVPYLAAEPDRVARWRDRIGGHGFRIGIAWQGNPDRREDAGRSIRLEHYLPLATVPGVRLISLQKDAGSEQLSPDSPVEPLGPDFDRGPDGFLDTAAVMETLDLVITSDTAVAHLAGALARPVWVALRFVPDWRWMLERTDSPWYPTMRLFRQPALNDWAPVFVAIRQALEANGG